MIVKLTKYSFFVCTMLLTGHAFAQNACPANVLEGSYIFNDSGSKGQQPPYVPYASTGSVWAKGNGYGVVNETLSEGGSSESKSVEITYISTPSGAPGVCAYTVNDTIDGVSFNLTLDASGSDGAFTATTNGVTVNGILHRIKHD